MAVRAPFNFARIPRKVWYPAWGDLVYHDVPFKDGWSGHIELEIEAKTELLIGGPRRNATDVREGEVWPVQLPDGTYAIPPSSLQGMTRAILETAFFGKLGPWVDDRRFGVRDISGSATGRMIYGDRMTEPRRQGTEQSPFEPRTRTGWLIKTEKGCALVPCKMARVHVEKIVDLVPPDSQRDLMRSLTSRDDAEKRLKAWKVAHANNLQIKIDPQGVNVHSHSGSKRIRYQRANIGGQTDATLVLTGKPNSGTGNGHKKWDFAFYQPDQQNATATDPSKIDVPDEVWRDFRLIHEPPKGSGQKENPNWHYWKARFENGEPVPVFYLEQVDAANVPQCGTIAAMGTTFMFKLAQSNSTHQMLENSSADHVSPQSCLDLPSLIFGAVAGEENKPGFKHSLKRRASFDWAVAELPNDARNLVPSNPTVLSSPKPSYYPIYVRQPARTHHQLQLRTKQHQQQEDNPSECYASFTPSVGDTTRERRTPELSGIKLWPGVKDGVVKETLTLPRPPAETNKKVQVKLHALPAGTRFRVDLHVHNLRTAEIGALLWALTFGDEAALRGKQGPYRHRLGMGKPFGMGSLAIAVSSVAGLKANVKKGETADVQSFCAALTKKVGDFLAEKDIQGQWEDSAQVKALQIAAGDHRKEQTHMQLDKPEHSYVVKRQNGWQDRTGPGPNSYVGARTMGHFLAPLADDGWEFDRPPAPVAPPSPSDRGNDTAQRTNQGRNQPVHQHRGIPVERGCRIRRLADGVEGELGPETHGMWTVYWDDGTSGPAPRLAFTVLAAPEE